MILRIVIPLGPNVGVASTLRQDLRASPMASSFPWPVADAIFFRGKAGYQLHTFRAPSFPWPVANAIFFRGEAGYQLHTV